MSGRIPGKACDPAVLVPMLLKTYERQVRRDLEALGRGDEEDEVQRRVGAMRDWGRFCWREADPQLRELRRVEDFGLDATEYAIRREEPASKCGKCGGDGWYYSEACQPRQHNQNRQTSTGFITCDCGAGKQRNTSILHHGKPKSPSRRNSF